MKRNALSTPRSEFPAQFRHSLLLEMAFELYRLSPSLRQFSESRRSIEQIDIISSHGPKLCDREDALWFPNAPMSGRWELNDEQWAVVEPVLRPERRAGIFQ
jgi:hypothetical protein